jgi:hypothetical protein
MFEIGLRNKAFKAKKNFLRKTSFLNFLLKCVLALSIYRVKKVKEVFLNFLPNILVFCLAQPSKY